MVSRERVKTLTDQCEDVVSSDRYALLVQPGCSSCLRAKEFLTRHNVPFTAIDVTIDRRGTVLMEKFGVRQIPLVIRGDEFEFGQDIADVARFVGIEFPNVARLSPTELVLRWSKILDVAIQLAHKIPSNILSEAPISGHPGTVRSLAYHIFSIPRAFVDCVARGIEDWDTNAMRLPPENLTPSQLAEVGRGAAGELRDWWFARVTIGPGDIVNTFQGAKSLHWFLERSTCHSAQHTRQLADVLDRNAVAFETEAFNLVGLPLPIRIWQ